MRTHKKTKYWLIAACALTVLATGCKRRDPNDPKPKETPPSLGLRYSK